MPRYVALFRAVNVAGHARISTAELVQIFAASGARDVSSFGHAGNLLFTAASGPSAIAARARARIGRKHGERPVIVVRSAAELLDLAAAEPFAACGRVRRRCDGAELVDGDAARAAARSWISCVIS